MIEVQWLTPGHAPSIPCLFHHFPGQPRRVGHNDVVMVPPQNFTRHRVHGAILRHHDPLWTLDVLFIAKAVQLLDCIGEVPVSPGKVIWGRVMIVVVGVCNREITGPEVRIYQQNQVAARFAEVVSFLRQTGGEFFLPPGAGLMLFLGNLEKLRLHGWRSGIIFAADVFLFSDIKAAAHTHYVLLSVNILLLNKGKTASCPGTSMLAPAPAPGSPAVRYALLPRGDNTGGSPCTPATGNGLHRS